MFKVTMTPTVREVRTLKEVTHDAPAGGLTLRKGSPSRLHVTAHGTGNLAGETWLEGAAGKVARTPLRYDSASDKYKGEITLYAGEVPVGDYDLKAVLEKDGAPVTEEVTAVEPLRLNLAEFCPPELKAEIEAFSAYFDTDRDDLHSDDLLRIQDFAGKLERCASQIRSIHITGHCDLRGTEIHNTGLGSRRAESVGKVLSTRLPGVSIDTRSLGFADPDPPGNNPEDWSKNRWARIQIDTN